MRRLLVLDDDPNILHALERTLRQCSFAASLRIERFTDPLDALARALEVDFDLVLSDFQMPEMNGIIFLQHFRQRQPNAVRLILSASTDFDTVMQAINEAEVFRYIPKPWCLSDLQGIILLALARRDQSDLALLQSGGLTPQQLAMRQLEAEEPGITRVDWDADGAVRLG